MLRRLLPRSRAALVALSVVRDYRLLALLALGLMLSLLRARSDVAAKTEN